METLKPLLKEIESSVKQEVNQILKEAKEKASDILRRAEAEAEKIRDISKKRILEEARERTKAEVALITLNEKRRYLAEREKIVNSLINETMNKIPEVISSKREKYRETMVSWIIDSLKNLNHHEAVISANEEDRAWLEREGLKKISEKLRENSLNIKLTLGPPIKTIGGYTMKTPNGGRILINTIEARVKSMKEDLRNIILKNIYG